MTNSTSNRQTSNWQGTISNGSTWLSDPIEPQSNDNAIVEETYELLPSGD